MKPPICFRQAPFCLLLVASLFLTASQPAAWAQDEFVVARDSIAISSTTGVVDHVWVWLPEAEFVLYGPLDKSSVIWLEAGLPGKKKWHTTECRAVAPLGERDARYRDSERATLIACNSDVHYEGTRTSYTGLVDFSLHMRNELRGVTDATLFQGKFKVAKKPHGGTVEFYTDEDWRIPIAFLVAGEVGPGGLRAELSFRKSVGLAVAYLFYQGKQLEEITCDEASVPLSKYAEVSVRKCEFWAVSKEANPYRPTEKKHLFNENPGEYEIKVMAGGLLVRSVKFSVGAEGSFDNGIATANKLGTLGVVVPARVIGTQDGVWNKLAWKTEAFYGNPLTGFTAIP